METVDHFPIITAVLGVLVSLVVLPEEVSVSERSAGVLTRDPGFQLHILSNLIASNTATAAAAGDKKQFTLRQCECASTPNTGVLHVLLVVIINLLHVMWYMR